MIKENIQIVRSSGPRNGTSVLHLKGSLNIHTIFEFQNAVRSEVGPAVIIDLAGVPFIDSAGLGALVGAYIASQRANRKVAFAAMNSQVKTLIEMTKVSQLFPMFASIQEAEAAVS
jgi:anti-sigma B factor antagonist